MNIGGTIHLARKRRGLSQSELAFQAGVGLATVQNIEANRANPALNTLMAIFRVLRIEVKLAQKEPDTDWAALVQLGCPLMGKGKATGVPTRTLLIEQLRALNPAALKGREAKAVASWLHALRDHYPSLWPEAPVAVRAWTQNQIVSPKLRRIALNQLAEFL